MVRKGEHVSGLKNAFDNFFDTEARLDLRALVACRIAAGLSLVLHYSSLYSYFQMAFGPDGLVGSRYFAHIPSAISIARGTVSGFQFLSFIEQPWLITFLYALLILSAFCFTIGFKTRVSGCIALALHFLFHAQNEYMFWGWGDMIKPVMAYVLFSPISGAVYSLDRKLSKGGWLPASASEYIGVAWPMRLLQVHVTTCYMVVAYPRLNDPNWLDGTMLYGILSDPLFSRINSEWRFFMGPLRLLCWGSWGLELFAPVCLWLHRTRRYWAIGLIIMHIGLEALTKVGYWNFIMIAALTSFLFGAQNEGKRK